MARLKSSSDYIDLITEILKKCFRYRKINLFQEAKLTPGDDNQKTTFKTDFGVTFGIFTCFDMLFHNPSRTVLKNPDVTDIVFPTAWISVLPFYHCKF